MPSQAETPEGGVPYSLVPLGFLFCGGFIFNLMDQGWIKLYRKFCEWEWFNISEMVHLFIYLLINANREPGVWRGVRIDRGQIITGRNSLSENTGISPQSIRTCLNRLKSTNEITIYSTNKYSIITIIKYDEYQCKNLNSNQQNNQQTDTLSTSNQPATNQQLTTNKKEENKEKEINKEEKNKKAPEFDFHFLDINFSSVFMEWIDYKKSRNEKYKTQKSLEACYRNLLRLANNNPEQAKLLIDQAMGNNWAGIFPLKTALAKKDFGIPDKERDYTTPQKF